MVRRRAWSVKVACSLAGMKNGAVQGEVVAVVMATLRPVVVAAADVRVTLVWKTNSSCPSSAA